MPKFGRDDHADVGLGLQPLGDRGELGLVEARRPDDAVDVLVDAEADVVHDDVGPGEVDDHLGAGVGDVEQPVAVVDHRDELEVVGRVDRLDHLGAHPAAGAEHPDVDERGVGRRRRDGLLVGVEVLVTRSGFPAAAPDATPAGQRAAGAAASTSQSSRPSSTPTTSASQSPPTACVQRPSAPASPR